LKNIDKLIPLINELLLWNGNFKQVMDHFETNSHYLPIWDEQITDSLESVNKTLEVINKIISDAHDSFSSEESPSTAFLIQS
jgi:hypothetical protein